MNLYSYSIYFYIAFVLYNSVLYFIFSFALFHAHCRVSRQKEPDNLVIRHSVPIKTLLFPTFSRIL